MTPLQKIITKSLKRDRRAQGELYRRFAPYALAVIRRYGVAARSEADLLQEIFIEVFAKLDRFDAAKGAFNTWLRALTVFRIIDHQRKTHRYDTVTLDAVPEPAADDLMNFPPDYLLSLIANLPPGYRTVFNLFAIEGYSHQQISEMLGITAAGSRSQYHRARGLLQRAVIQHKKKVADAS